MDKERCSVCGNGLLYHAMGADHTFVNTTEMRELENEVDALRLQVQALEKSLAVEKEWVQALTEDNGRLIEKLDEHDIRLIEKLDEHDIPLPCQSQEQKKNPRSDCTIAHDHFRPGSCWGCMNEELNTVQVSITELVADIEEVENEHERLLRLVKKLLPLRRLRPAVTAAERMLDVHSRLLRHLATFGNPDKGDQLAQEQQSWLMELEAAVQYARE